MLEKTIQQTNSNPMKERFEFVLTVNGYIVCQRYFRINGFNPESEYSFQLVNAIDNCVNMIQKDLKYKSNVYLWNCAPQTFANLDEMNKWVANPTFNLPVASYVVLADTHDVYIWDGEKMALYEQPFNVLDWVGGIDSDSKNVLKFAFLDDGKEICSKEWDANVYPRFVRSNIDLSNSKNKYNQDGQYSPIEAYLIDCMIKGRQDIIPLIVREICSCCSSNDENDEYTTIFSYGKKTYNFDVKGINRKYIRSVERSVKDKTDKYFKNLY